MKKVIWTWRRICKQVLCSHTGERTVSNGQTNTILQRGRQGWTVLDVTLDIPEYNGNMKWNKCLDLLSVVERTFYYKGDVWHEGQAITIKLKGQALSWWELNQINGVKDEQRANDIMGQDEAIDDGALFQRLRLYSNRITLSADFISTRKRNPTFLSLT